VKKRILIALVVVLALAATASLVWATSVMTIVSDTNVDVYGPLGSYAGLNDSAWGSMPDPAVETWVHPSWASNVSIPGATWISTAYQVEEPVNDSWRKFSTTFELCARAYDIQATMLSATSDNAEEVYFNGLLVGSYGEVHGPFIDNWEWADVISYAIAPEPGVNTLDFIVRNYAQSGGSVTSNPTGLIYKADITYDCPIQVDIDIKPGSIPNCFNVNGHGVIPVAILGAADFDVSQIDTSSLTFGGLTVRFKGKNGPQCSIQDVSGNFVDYAEGGPDGQPDLVCQFVDEDSAWTAGDDMATLIGTLLDGTPFEGTDSICVVPAE